VRLRDAIHQLTDPALLEAWRSAQMLVELPYIFTVNLPAPPPPDELEKIETNNKTHDKISKQKRLTREAVQQDFRQRVGSGEIILERLQYHPTLERQRTIIPAVWSNILHILFERDQVHAARMRFREVVAWRAPHVGRWVEAVGLACARDTVSAKPVRPRGRESAVPVIEEDLNLHWAEDQLRRNRSGRDHPVWSEFARIIHKRIRKRYPTSQHKVPHEQTIRKHLPEIYARLLRDKSAR
jgi:hypothetical protein